MPRCVTRVEPRAGERRMTAPWRCDHCALSLQVVCVFSTDCAAIAELASDDHQRARPHCHAEHGAAGIRFLQTKYPG